MRIVVTMPVLDDWESCSLLCARIDQIALSLAEDVSVGILILDDGSSTLIPPDLVNYKLTRVDEISVLTLRRNLGHQRAIGIGLTYIQQKIDCDAVIVMDADGEDRPEDIVRLAEQFQERSNSKAVFAERGRRFEGIFFKIFYTAYRVLHFVLTGRTIRIGNFSILPRKHLNALVACPDLWNHYAAAVIKCRLQYSTVRLDRARRLRGSSKMSFVGLVIHGFSALFAFQEIVSTRLLIASITLGIIFLVLIATVLVLKLFTPLAIPGWASLISGLLALLLFQSLVASIVVVFSAMISRNSLGYLPLRDYTYFVSGHHRISPR